VDVPQVLVSDFSAVSVMATGQAPALDRFVGQQSIFACASRSYVRPRPSHRSVQVDGGLPTVVTAAPGTEISLIIPVAGRAALEEVEATLREKLLFYMPYNGTPVWISPGSWVTTFQMRNVWVVSLTVVVTAPPPLPDPMELIFL
jgi:hypothetical protein